jgi:hypothetical protein
MVNIGYGPTGALSDAAARAYELRDLIHYDNVTYGCNYDANNECARLVASRNWRVRLAEGMHMGMHVPTPTREYICGDFKWCVGRDAKACCLKWRTIMQRSHELRVGR